MGGIPLTDPAAFVAAQVAFIFAAAWVVSWKCLIVLLCSLKIAKAAKQKEKDTKTLVSQWFN